MAQRRNIRVAAAVLLAVGAAGVARASTTTTNGGGNILPTTFPVSMFPVTTQTHFDSPACTASAGAAAAASGEQHSQSFGVNYNFESVTRGDPVTALTEIGVYNLLNFSSINFVDTDPDFDGNHLGLAPYTYPNVATFNTDVSLLDGLVLDPSAATVSAGYIESTLDGFMPHRFHYGCVFPFPYTAGSLPVDCNITAAGYNAAGARVATQVFNFAANGSIIQDQNLGRFHAGFANIYTLGFGVDDGLAAAALIDNLVATLTQKACAPFYDGSY